eukprot:CAMPEP_0202697568 /NCGR_PEP_ID=MMETSP1385-20130828/10915_1 /ASSEMBLY_ACC=CAM_ASM_000861 /TAXON_ID=933848 /ORGANISM="Elphidium margaritaceum" /LENGTH=951 /DNA_ID=CAMNT_0049354067 /DNA_START=30 /DNA_END=2885 /DNA_ORIENTATION=+
MDWGDSVFREHVKYYGDVEYTPGNTTGDNGIVASKNYMAFRHHDSVGILSTDFESNIAEKLAQGRKAEYGSKVYTTTKIDHVEPGIEGNIKALHFTPFNDDELLVGDSNGALSLYELPSASRKLRMEHVSSSIYSLASHPFSSEFLVVGGDGNLNLIDLNKQGASIVDTKLDKEQIVRAIYSNDGSVVYGVTADKLLLMYDPRTKATSMETLKLRFTPTNVVNLDGDHSQIAVCGLTSFLEPIIVGYDLAAAAAATVTGAGAGAGAASAFHEQSALFEQNYAHKQCTPYMHYDGITRLLYVAFESCGDLLVFNANENFSKQALYHSVTDTFMSMVVLPKHACSRRTINRVLKFSKTRIQQVVHTRGGKLIYERIASTPRSNVCTLDAYLTGSSSSSSSSSSSTTATLVPIDFEEQKKRAVSLYLHVTGKEPLSVADKYFDLQVSATVNCTLGLNLKSNAKYALFPAPTYGGGALGVIALHARGRKKQAQLSAHSDKIMTFDIGRRVGDNDALVLTGSADAKAIVSRINVKDKAEEQGQIVGVEAVHTLKCVGRVTFVGFHPRIARVCVVAANKEGNKEECVVYVYDYVAGAVLAEYAVTPMFNIVDVQFEPSIGLIAALSGAQGNVKLMDIRSGAILKAFCTDTFARDTKLFWATDQRTRLSSTTMVHTRLIALGFGRQSMRKFSVYDVRATVEAYYAANVAEEEEKQKEEEEHKEKDEDEEEEETMEAVASHSFGVSNSIPIGYYDGYDGLLYVSSIGDRKIRVYELSGGGVKEMNAAFQSGTDIQGLSFALKQEVSVESVEMAKCLKLAAKDGEIATVSFVIPRKRTQYFQDDLYLQQVVDVANTTIGVDWTDLQQQQQQKVAVNVTRISLKPSDMQLLSEAPDEEESTLKKRRNSHMKAMEKERLKEQPQSTEQAFDQFSRMVADAPTANRWDAVNIGTEVADDEWSD